MATYYWVGGSGTWNASTTTNWASSSGGAGSAGVPTSTDNVIFDTSSGTGTVTITAASATCQDFTVTATQSLFFSGLVSTCTGSLSLPSSGSAGAASLQIIFTATTTGKTITTNSKTVANITFNGVGGGWTLGSSLTTSTTTPITLTNGSFNTGNFNITTGSFVYSGTGTATLTLGTSTVTTSSISTPWNFATTTGLTFSGASSTINLGGVNGTFAGGGLTYGTVSFTNTVLGTTTITGANTFSTLSVIARTNTGVGTLNLGANQTVTTSFSVQSGATDPARRVFVKSDTAGTQRTITSASNTLWGVDFQDIVGAGAASWSDSSRTGYWGNCKNNSGITFATGRAVYWNLAGTQNWSATGWAATSTGTPNTQYFPLAQDTATFTNAGSTGTVTVDVNFNIGTIDMSGRTSAMTLGTSSNSPIIYGDWTNGSGTTLSGAGTITFSGRTTQTITSNSISFTQTIQISSFGGTVQQADALVTSSSLSLSIGTYLTQNNNLTCSSFSYIVTGTAALTLGTSTVTLSGTGTVWSFNTVTGLTFSGTSSTIALSNTTTTARTFLGGGLAYGTLSIGGATGTSTLTLTNSAGSFTNIASTKTVAHTISITANLSIGNWTAVGTSGNLITVQSSLAGTQRTITYTGSSKVSMDYMSIKDINFSYTLGASNPYLVYAGANSTNGGNNSGVAFIASTQTAYILNASGSWTTPADWSNASNTIHMIGAGGGGANAAVSGNNRAAGGGGGGGGYTVLTNQTLSGAISYTIGTSAANANGTDTTWNSGAATAGGGSKGNAATTPSSSGGAGGTGTYAGGTGGAGSTSTAASIGNGSGAGGGAGGPNGIGGNGGNGFSATSNILTSGGGGGGNGGGSAGTNGSSGLGGNGGNNFGGTGSGTGGNQGAGTAGTFGGGGGGASNNSSGGQGGSGIDIANTIGGGGGKGGQGSGIALANTGLYGGGGAGGGVSTAGTASTGGAGSQGVIFIVYTPGAAPAVNGNFFFMFG